MRGPGGPVGVRLLLTAATRAPGGAAATLRAALMPSPDGEQLILERDRLLESERRERARASAALARLGAMQSLLAGPLTQTTLEERLREMTSRARLAVGADAACVSVLRGTGDRLDVLAADHGPPRSDGGPPIPPSRAVARSVAARVQAVNLDDLAKSGRIEKTVRRRARSLAAVPLVVEGRCVGALQAASRHARRFGEEDLRLLEVTADRMAAAVDRARLEEEARAGRERMVALSGRVLDVGERERRAIARELHDEIGQILTGLLCLLETEARVRTPGEGTGGARVRRRRLGRMKGLVAEAMRRVRGLCMNLRPAGLEGGDLESTLRWYLARYTEQTGVRVRLDSAVNGRRLPSELQAVCFRIVQESLTNVARHARAGEARVSVRAGPGHLNLEVRDRGRGFDVRAAARRPTCGLSGMRERALLLGGDLVIQSSRGAGTTVTAVLPIPAGGRGGRSSGRPARGRPVPGRDSRPAPPSTSRAGTA
jgi:signal transduction histidine kinase